MAHLGSDVAAFVDGQLSEPAMRDAETHLATCEECEQAVRQQRILKSRVSTVAAPQPPAALLAQLASLAEGPLPRESRWARVSRSLPFRSVVALAGASVAMVVTAYAVGGPEPAVGDEVSPPVDRYVARFAEPGAGPAGTVITAATMDELDGDGWPCHEVLAGDLHRVSGSYTEGDEVVTLRYSDGGTRLDLFEQNGRLDPDGLERFDRERVGGADVWVREGVPLVVTWDDRAGTVYTIVSDADRDRVARAVAELPGGRRGGDGVAGRVGDGLSRMTSWVDAA